MAEVLVGHDLFYRADAIAAEAHRGMRLHGTNPYIFHPRAVAQMANEMGYGFEVQATALLHDTLEDSEIDKARLLSEGIPLVVVEGVEAVTWTDFDAGSKIAKAMSHPLGHVVKFFDASHNLGTGLTNIRLNDQERAYRLAKKYASYLGLLAVGLPTPREIEDYLKVRM